MIDPRDHDHPAGEGCIRMYPSLTWVDMLRPTEAMIHPEDIAHHLSLVNRFGGGTPSPYSVAEHSLNVAAQLNRLYGDDTLTFCGLLHDASEAYLGDMVRPLKTSNEMLPFRVAEQAMERAISERFDLPDDVETWAKVKEIDNDILGWEMAIVRDSLWRTPTPAAVIEKAFVDSMNQLRWRMAG